MAEPQKYRLMTKRTLGRTFVSLLALIAITALMLTGLLIPAAATVGLTARYTTEAFDDIPSELKILTPSQKSVMYAADGKQIASFYAENRIIVPIDKISPMMQKAIVAVEDRRFFQHNGVDMEGLVRAAVNNALGRDTQGASTLTQQYVKNSLIEKGLQSGDRIAIQKASEHSLSRKLKEARYALELEKTMSKQQILAGYLNIAPFGAGAYGVEAAAQRYFSTNADKLDVAQAALLAGLVQSPSAYNPLLHPEIAQERRDDVLQLMRSQSIISEKQYQDAVATPVKQMLKPKDPQQGCAAAGSSAYFCAWVLQQLANSPQLGKTYTERRSKLLRGGLKIYTTLDAKAQQDATQAIQDNVPINDPSGVNAALVSVQPGTGNILAMAQNTNFGKPTKNDESATETSFAADTEHGGGIGQQPGSSYKAFTLAAWFAAGHSGNDYVGGRTHYNLKDWKIDCPTAAGSSWDLHNSEHMSPAKTTVIRATQKSLNTGYADMAQRVGLCQVQQMAQALGAVPGGEVSKDQNIFYPPSILGAGSVPPIYMANAYATIIDSGKRCELNSIVRVNGADGKEIFKTTPECKQAMPAKAAQQTAKVLQMTYDEYGAPIAIGRPAIAKTGTTDNAANAWLVGATPNIATAVWIGHANSLQPMLGITINGRYYRTVWGSTLPTATWRQYMSAVTQGTPVVAIPDVDLGKPTLGAPPAARRTSDAKRNQNDQTDQNEKKKAEQPAKPEKKND